MKLFILNFFIKDLASKILKIYVFGNNVNIKCDSFGTKMTGYGELGKMKVEISEADMLKYAYEEDLNVSQEFNLDFIEKMCKFEKISNEIFIHFDTSIIVNIKYNFFWSI